MNKAERIKRLTKGLMLLILAQAGYTLAVIVYQEQIQLLCAMLSLVGGIWGLAVLSPLAADYKRALVMCLIVQIALGLLSLPMDRFVIGYLVVRVGMYVGTYLQAWLVCGATAQEMQYLNRTDLETQGRMIPKLYVLELAGRILNLLSILLPDRVRDSCGLLLSLLVIAILAVGNLMYLIYLWKCRQAALPAGKEPPHL